MFVHFGTVTAAPLIHALSLWLRRCCCCCVLFTPTVWNHLQLFIPVELCCDSTVSRSIGSTATAVNIHTHRPKESVCKLVLVTWRFTISHEENTNKGKCRRTQYSEKRRATQSTTKYFTEMKRVYFSSVYYCANIEYLFNNYTVQYITLYCTVLYYITVLTSLQSCGFYTMQS